MDASSDDADDADLMLAYARGDPTAFDALYARHRGGVYRYLLRHCGNTATAEELFQDVWMNVIRARSSYARAAARFATWLYTVAHHRIVDYWRASGQFVTLSIDGDDAANDAVHDVSAPRIDEPELRAGNRELGERLRAAIAALPPVQRDAFLLQHEGGLSLGEIADLNGVGVETIKSRLRYATGRLRASLRELRADAAE